MEKSQFRKKQLKVLTDFAKTEQKQKEDQILTRAFLKSNLLKNAQKIGITLSMPLEVDTSEIIAELWELGKEVYIPRCLPNRQMEFTKFTYKTQLTPTKFGTQENHEPQAIVDNHLDLIVLPLLAFGQKQHARLGFGGGYYDRFLAQHDLAKISLVNSKQLFQEAEWPVDHHDIAIENYLTV